MNQQLAERAYGVLGAPQEQRSVRDQKMQQEYGQCKKEGYAMEGVTGQFNQYGERRSLNDQRMLKEYNSCGAKENYESGGCQYAKISDNPNNPAVGLYGVISLGK